MVQGITSLDATQQPPSGGMPQDAINALGKGFNSLDPQELTKLRELQDDLSELSPDKLKVLEQILQFLKKNSSRYDDAVKLLVSKGVIEPGDLPPEYIPAFFSILEQMVMQALQGGGEQKKFAKGGIASLRKKAAAVQQAGTGGDKVLAHINPREAAMLQATRGGGMNPNTGLPEYGFFDDIGSFLKSAAGVVLPVALGFMGVPPVIAGAVGSGIGAMINGASPGQALQAAALGGIGGAAFSGLTNIGQEGGFWGGVSKGFEPGPGMLGEAMGYKAPSVSPAVAPSQGGPMAGANAPPMQTGAAASPSMLTKAGNWMSQHPFMTAGIAGLGGAALASAMTPEQQQQAASLPAGATQAQIDAARFPAGSFRQYAAPKVNVVPTYSPAYPNYPSYYAAKGGELDARIGGHLHGPGTGTSDSIPARLSDGEFVMTAKAVRGAGDGDRKAGAKKMYDLMHRFEKRA